MLVTTVIQLINLEVAGARQMEVEIPSYVDDIIGVICDWEGTLDMKLVGEKAAAIMEEVAAE